MQCEDLEIELPNAPRLNELDSALHELGMLASFTNSRQEYLKEMQQKPIYNMLTINTRYVSNVSIGFQLRPTTPHVRYKPYQNPKREERHRTKSENNDVNETLGIVKGLLEETVNEKVMNDLLQLKKAKSLESIIAENNKDVDLTKITIPEVQVVSDLEKLKVGE
ncbi:hypothetical protein RN001_013026 [Aquatica leii]|uniref:Uncharacterized protein n=1 Tax=Aquatica leii TaxID=1421715 RepID=A0AAN7P3T1_9COLE|nr:hypothetical protein RN001_013026 [Aquatica leii]